MNHASQELLLVPNVIDLHTHTDQSDGYYSPDDLVKLTADAGLETIAVTDHDTVAGVEAAVEAGRRIGVEVIPGIEFSTTVDKGEIHMLGLWVDVRNPDLLDMTEKLKGGRDASARQMVEKLREMGMDKLRWERVRELAGQSTVGRPAIARAMLEQGYIEKFEDAFTKEYIDHGGKAYVPRHKLLPEDAVRLVHRAGGVAVLAHPTFADELPRTLASLARAGLDGMEVYYSGYGPAVRADLMKLARKFSLLPGGGSDFHGVPSMNEQPLGTHYVPRFVLDGLRQRHARLTRDDCQERGSS